MDNMDLYKKGQAVPKEAQKAIGGGRLKGMTDINPMWRIAKLTEMFGPCGIGWKYVITRREIMPGCNDEIACFLDVDLFYKHNGEWSEAVPGTGGASFIAKEKSGLYMSDECYKMALTDALSVACKALGIGADVYWAAGRSKYSQQTGEPPQQQQPKADVPICEDCGAPIKSLRKSNGEVMEAKDFIAFTMENYGKKLCYTCHGKAAAAKAGEGA